MACGLYWNAAERQDVVAKCREMGIYLLSLNFFTLSAPDAARIRLCLSLIWLCAPPFPAPSLGLIYHAPGGASTSDSIILDILVGLPLIAFTVMIALITTGARAPRVEGPSRKTPEGSREAILFMRKVALANAIVFGTVMLGLRVFEATTSGPSHRSQVYNFNNVGRATIAPNRVTRTIDGPVFGTGTEHQCCGHPV